jgi:hypothetical protein
MASTIFGSEDVSDSDSDAEMGDDLGNELDSDIDETADRDGEEDISDSEHNGDGFDIAEDVNFSAPEFRDMISDKPLKPSLRPAAAIPGPSPVSQAANTPVVWAFKTI